MDTMWQGIPRRGMDKAGDRKTQSLVDKQRQPSLPQVCALYRRTVEARVGKFIGDRCTAKDAVLYLDGNIEPLKIFKTGVAGICLKV
jgi:hypothetical protein